jgi:hypothetical protein
VRDLGFCIDLAAQLAQRREYTGGELRIGPRREDGDNAVKARVSEVLGFEPPQVLFDEVIRNGRRERQPVVGVVKDSLGDLYDNPLAHPCWVGLAQMLERRLM